MANNHELQLGIEQAAVEVSETLAMWRNPHMHWKLRQQGANPDSTKVSFTGEKSSLGDMGETYRYLAVKVDYWEYKTPIRIGLVVARRNKIVGLAPAILEFDKGKKHWDYDPTEKPPKYVRRTFKALGATGLVA